MKYKIMRKLEFGKYTSLETVVEWFPGKSIKSVGMSIDLLGKLGFIEASDDLNGISLRTISSFQDFLEYQRKKFFEYSVGVSAIIIAIESSINIFQILLH